MLLSKLASFFHNKKSFQKKKPYGGVRKTDPDTSYDAASDTRRLRKTEKITLETLKIAAELNEGLSAQEISDISGLLIQSVTPSLSRLEKANIVCKTQYRRSALGGKGQIVWTTKENAKTFTPRQNDWRKGEKKPKE